MENELVLMPEDLTKLGFENVGGDPISYWTINKRFVYRNNGTGKMYKVFCGNHVIFKNNGELLDYVNYSGLPKQNEEKKEPEKQEENLTLTHAELLAYGFNVNGVLLNENFNEYCKDGIIIYRDFPTGTIMYIDDWAFIPFKSIKDFNIYLSRFDKRACEKAVDEKPGKIKDFHICPNIQEELNNIFENWPDSEKKVNPNTRELKKKLEDEIIEKLNKFESETGCRINEVRFLKQNTISGNDDSYKNLINIIAVV